MKGSAKLISLHRSTLFLVFFPSTGNGCSGGSFQGSAAACIALLHSSPKNSWEEERQLPFICPEIQLLWWSVSWQLCVHGCSPGAVENWLCRGLEAAQDQRALLILVQAA